MVDPVADAPEPDAEPLTDPLAPAPFTELLPLAEPPSVPIGVTLLPDDDGVVDVLLLFDAPLKDAFSDLALRDATRNFL